MEHKGTKEIETKRLVLRQFREADAPAAFKNYTTEEEVTRFLTWPPHESVETTGYVLRDWIKDYEKDDCYQWAIELKEINEPIGSISIVRMNEKTDAMTAGYCIGSRWWRQGIVSEAFAAVIAFLFDEVKAKRIEACHDTNNPNSGKVMQKCGLKYEGTLRRADFNNQGICDIAVYSILAGEYYAGK